MTLDPGAPPSPTFDKGPNAALAAHFASVPGYAPEVRDLFWYDWGPVFYRGRLTGTAKLLAIASDPGPTERVVGRTLVGDAGQRVQGFLTKVGLTRSYVLVNAFPYAVHPTRVPEALPLLQDPAHLAWRNRLLDLVTGPALEAVIAFGGNAQRALDLWDDAPDVPTFRLPHPSSHDTADLVARWRAALPQVGGDHAGPGREAGRSDVRRGVQGGRLRRRATRGPAVRPARVDGRRPLGADGEPAAQQRRRAVVVGQQPHAGVAGTARVIRRPAAPPSSTPAPSAGAR